MKQSLRPEPSDNTARAARRERIAEVKCSVLSRFFPPRIRVCEQSQYHIYPSANFYGGENNQPALSHDNTYACGYQVGGYAPFSSPSQRGPREGVRFSSSTIYSDRSAPDLSRNPSRLDSLRTKVSETIPGPDPFWGLDSPRGSSSPLSTCQKCQVFP